MSRLDILRMKMYFEELADKAEWQVIAIAAESLNKGKSVDEVISWIQCTGVTVYTPVNEE